MRWPTSVHTARIAERLRQSLFVLPGLCLVTGVILAEVIVRLDRSGAGAWLPDSWETSTPDARSVLSAIATGTITVVTLVLTLTLVAIQLASGQLSPRTIVNFLGDRFQQATVGVVLGTATFSLLALRSLGLASESVDAPNLTVLAAVFATIASLIMLVVSVDRTAKRLAVGNLLNDVARETCQLAQQRYGGTEPAADVERPGFLLETGAGRPAVGEGVTSVVAGKAGWVQYIDEEQLLEPLPEKVGVEILHPVGTFVLADMELVRIEADVDASVRDQVGSAIAIGDSRTMQQDVSFGLTRLTDIGLRALSPGINDPNTAREVILRVAQVILTLQQYELEADVVEIRGRRVRRRGAPSHDAFARDGFEQLRHGAHDDVATLRTLVRALRTVIDETERRGLPAGTDELERQERLAGEQLQALGAGDDPGGGTLTLP